MRKPARGLPEATASHGLRCCAGVCRRPAAAGRCAHRKRRARRTAQDLPWPQSGADPIHAQRRRGDGNGRARRREAKPDRAEDRAERDPVRCRAAGFLERRDRARRRREGRAVPGSADRSRTRRATPPREGHRARPHVPHPGHTTIAEGSAISERHATAAARMRALTSTPLVARRLRPRAPAG